MYHFEPIDSQESNDMSVQKLHFYKDKSKAFLKRAKYVILYALNPAKVLTEKASQKWYLYLFLPAYGWMFFFAQVGFDKSAEYYVPVGQIALISALGFIAGYAAVAGTGYLVHLIMKKLKIKVRFDQITSCIAMSHTYMVFSLVLGFIYRIFGAGSSAAFGVAGFLCTLLPIYSGLRTLGRGNAFFAPLMATLIGTILLFIWRLLMFVPL